ncbi:MAG: adenylyl-sulfate kinase [Planctomycetota bacterium]
MLWLTGLSGSGKSTFADALAPALEKQGLPVERLDGDLVRALFPQTGFTREERNLHVGRMGFLASRLERHGVTVVASFISPYREGREAVRRLCRRFVLVHVATPLQVCEQRDVKGLYARARRGEITHFTGVDDPYEEPADPQIRIDTADTSVEEAVERVLAYLGTLT